MKKIYFLMALILCAGCGGNESNTSGTLGANPALAIDPQAILASTLSVDAITIRPGSVENVGVGDTIQFSATVEFSDGLQQVSAQHYFYHEAANFAGHLIWRSSDESIASVSQNGLVETHAPGAVVIHCTNPWIPNFPSDAVTISISDTGAASPEMNPPESDPNDNPAQTPEETPPEAVETPTEPQPDSGDPYADKVVSYFIGEQGGFNEDQLPHIVLGPPYGGGCCQGSFDVFSLGIGGEIILEFADFIAFDGEGDDFIVFENGFQVGTDPENIFSEPGIVAVSQDGTTWYEFSCDLSGPPYEGCAGTQATLANPDQNQIDPQDPAAAGGNAFNLADVGLDWARFVKITDSGLGLGPIGSNTGGFDLDAVVIINARAP